MVCVTNGRCFSLWNYGISTLVKVRGGKNVEGQDEFAGAVTSIIRRAPAEGGREVRLYSSG